MTPLLLVLEREEEPLGGAEFTPVTSTVIVFLPLPPLCLIILPPISILSTACPAVFGLSSQLY